MIMDNERPVRISNFEICEIIPTASGFDSRGIPLVPET
jgi:hypothetical protein